MRAYLRVAVLFAGALIPSCQCSSTSMDHDAGATECNPACSNGEVCRYGECVPTPKSCGINADCVGDTYCDNMECIPWGVGPGGDKDPACKRDPIPGVFFPGAQCEWTAPPAGDAFPDHRNVLATPMVATLYHAGEFFVPSIVFTSYNFDDGGAESCAGTNPDYYGVIRVIDGKTCAQQATISSPSVVASASVALADLGGRDATPEIVAARTQGGLVAFTLNAASTWEVLWQTTSTFADAECDWAGPSIHDLDDDGHPEVLFYGNVYDGATGAVIDESLGNVSAMPDGFLPVAADVDGDGVIELVTASELYAWDKVARKWTPKAALPATSGHTAVADFGTFPQTGADDRATKDGIAEVAVVISGNVKVFNIYGREVFAANMIGIGTNPAVGNGGPPTIADFDGDGRVEFATAGASAYHVFDLDCVGTPDPTTCPSMRTDGIAWVKQSQDFSSNVTGSTVFDFDGDGRAEAVYGDECFTRVYDGLTGTVLYSRFRTSCTWFEQPIVVDTDNDYNAEIVTTNNANCAVSCPAMDPIFDGVQCFDSADCPQAAPCEREQASDALGRCRCSIDADCGGDGFVCADPIAGPSSVGKVCRASHPGTDLQGVRVLADSVDRWVNTRPIWNQHAYSVTNVDSNGLVPRTSQWLRNWTQMGLNNFRQNAPGDGETAGAIPDLTVRSANVSCDASPTITADVCNRGTEPVAPGLPVAVYDSNDMLRCQTLTTDRMQPGNCLTVSCSWTGPNGAGAVVVDSSGANLECREDNNDLAISVNCP